MRELCYQGQDEGDRVLRVFAREPWPSLPDTPVAPWIIAWDDEDLSDGGSGEHI